MLPLDSGLAVKTDSLLLIYIKVNSQLVYMEVPTNVYFFLPLLPTDQMFYLYIKPTDSKLT